MLALVSLYALVYYYLYARIEKSLYALVSSYYCCVGRVHDAHGDGHEGHGEFDCADPHFTYFTRT